MVVPSALPHFPRCWYWLQCTSFPATLYSTQSDNPWQYNKGEWLLPAWSVILFTFISACIAVCIGFSTSLLARSCQCGH